MSDQRAAAEARAREYNSHTTESPGCSARKPCFVCDHTADLLLSWGGEQAKAYREGYIAEVDATVATVLAENARLTEERDATRREAEEAKAVTESSAGRLTLLTMEAAEHSTKRAEAEDRVKELHSLVEDMAGGMDDYFIQESPELDARIRAALTAEVERYRDEGCSDVDHHHAMEMLSNVAAFETRANRAEAALQAAQEEIRKYEELVQYKDRELRGAQEEIRVFKDALQNMSGAFDTPVERRRRPFDSFQEEAVSSMRAALSPVESAPEGKKHRDCTCIDCTPDLWCDCGRQMGWLHRPTCKAKDRYVTIDSRIDVRQPGVESASPLATESKMPEGWEPLKGWKVHTCGERRDPLLTCRAPSPDTSAAQEKEK